MSRLKRIIAILSISILSIIALVHFIALVIIFPIVFDRSSEEVSNILVEINDNIVVIEKDSIPHPIEIYLVLSREDHLNPLSCGDIILYTTDINLINKALSLMRFKKTNSDMCTLTSKIYIVSNNKVIFKSDISIESDCIGIQSSELGWCKAIDPDALMEVFSQFSVYRNPILYLD